MPGFTSDKVLAAIERDRATIFDGVPTMFSALLAHAEQTRYDTSSLRVCVSGGDAIPAHVLEAFEQRYKYPRLVEFRDTLPLTGAGKVVKKDLA